MKWIFENLHHPVIGSVVQWNFSLVNKKSFDTDILEIANQRGYSATDRSQLYVKKPQSVSHFYIRVKRDVSLRLQAPLCVILVY
jgi:hypothetical protein